jgi:alkyl hydroperoxide reductase subunit AhpC
MADRIAMVGTRAPDFSLFCVDRPGAAPRQATLADYLDRWLILIFYPQDFSLL